MQIDQITSEGLKRAYKIVIGENEIEEKIESYLNDMKDRVRMPGFRPGKAPISLLKKIHGDSVRGQVLQELMNDSTQKVFNDNDYKPAMQPTVQLASEVQDKDFTFNIDFEILPTTEIPDIEAIKLERLVVEPSAKEIDTAVLSLAEQQKQFKDAPKKHKAKLGDAVVIDFVGSIDGVEFEGGTSEGIQLELGTGTLIPGFEEQLEGVQSGDNRDVNLTFPEDYGQKDVAGKDAVFAVTVNQVRVSQKAKADEDFAKGMGFEDLDALRDTVKQRLQSDLSDLSRLIMKRKLLDHLAEVSSFDVPIGMVDVEFNQIWTQIKSDMIAAGEGSEADFEGMDGPSDKAEFAEYRSIAERRVRLGLLLSDIGMANDVQIAQDDVNRRITEEARKYPGKEQEVLKFYQENENAQASIRAPMYEESVCDLIFDRAKLSEKKVTRQQLEDAYQALDDDVEGKSETKKKAPKKAAQKAKSKAGEKKAKAASGTAKKSTAKKTKKPVAKKKPTAKKK